MHARGPSWETGNRCLVGRSVPEEAAPRSARESWSRGSRSCSRAGRRSKGPSSPSGVSHREEPVRRARDRLQPESPAPRGWTRSRSERPQGCAPPPLSARERPAQSAPYRRRAGALVLRRDRASLLEPAPRGHFLSSPPGAGEQAEPGNATDRGGTRSGFRCRVSTPALDSRRGPRQEDGRPWMSPAPAAMRSVEARPGALSHRRA